MRWAEITAECNFQAADAVSYAFIEAGCGGVRLDGTAVVAVRGCLPVTDELSPKLETLRAHLDRFPAFGLPAVFGGLTLRYIEDEDWANAWKQHFKPLRIGARVVVKPSWELYDAGPEDLILELDPGMAFGTGGHPTTQLCLKALEERVTPGMIVADVGTGSGILSIAAARLGADRVFAVDCDFLPRRVAAENVDRNDLADVISVLDQEPFDAIARDCDVVVVNIVANTIIELAESIASRLKAGGLCIASGIVEEHDEVVSGALNAVGIEIVERKREDIWLCLIGRRTGDGTDADRLSRAGRELPPITEL